MPFGIRPRAFRGKWKSRILCLLSQKETMRYSAVRRDMCNITDAVLAASLKELIEGGMVERKQFDEIPPRVEYSLTEKGRSAIPMLRSICSRSGAYHKDCTDKTPARCRECDYNR